MNRKLRRRIKHIVNFLRSHPTIVERNGEKSSFDEIKHARAFRQTNSAYKENSKFYKYIEIHNSGWSCVFSNYICRPNCRLIVCTPENALRAIEICISKNRQAPNCVVIGVASYLWSNDYKW